MPEQRIVITIDEHGKIEAKTAGFKGEACLEALDEILSIEKNVEHIKKTDEYYQNIETQQKRTVKNKRGPS